LQKNSREFLFRFFVFFIKVLIELFVLFVDPICKSEEEQKCWERNSCVTVAEVLKAREK
jgi:hypothetical protein